MQKASVSSAVPLGRASPEPCGAQMAKGLANRSTAKRLKA